MKRYIFTIFYIIIVYGTANSNPALKISNFDASNYPSVSVEFMAFDTSGAIINSLFPQQVNVSDNSIIRAVNSVNCPQEAQTKDISLLICFDLAISSEDSSFSKFNSAKALAKEVFKYASVNNECGLAGFDIISYIFHQFSQDLNSLSSAVDFLERSRGSYFNAGLLSIPTGAIEMIKNRENEKVILLITDASSSADADSIIALARTHNIKLYVAGLNSVLSDDIVRASRESGGTLFYNILPSDDFSLWAKYIFAIINGQAPCEMEFESVMNCDKLHNIVISIPTLQSTDSFSYSPHRDRLAHIKSEPEFLSFGGLLPPLYKELDISITAVNSNIFIDSIIVQDWHFSITSGQTNNVLITENDTHNLRLRFTPSDSALTFTKLIFYSNSSCYGNEIPITAGFPNTIPVERTVRLESPNCGETLIVGDTLKIKWSGLLPKDVIQLEFSNDNGRNWDTLAYDLNGLEYNWIIPDTPSDSCLVRIIQLWPNNIGRTMDLPHRLGVNSAMFNFDETLVVTASDDTTARVWSANNGRELLRLMGHTQPLLWAEFSLDDKYIVTASQDSTAIVWHTKTGNIVQKLIGHTSDVRAARFSPDSKQIMTVGRDGYVFFWDFLNGKIVDTLDFSPLQFWFAEYSIDGNFVVVSGNDRYVKMWDINKKEVAKIFDTGIAQEGQGINVHVSFSKDMKKLVTSSWYGKTIVWDVETTDTLFCVSHIDSVGSSSAMFFGSFDHTGDTLLTSGFDHRSIMWDANTGNYIATLFEHRSSVKTGVFNFDGMRILTSSWDFTAKLWNRGKRDLQMDTSDCVFRVIRAKIDARDIDFGPVALGDAVDSIVYPFIINNTGSAIVVRDIRVEGISRGDFNILSDFAPFVLDSGERRKLELRFRPLNLGVRLAKITIIIPNDTISINLTGEGYLSDLQSMIKFIDFSEVDIGDFKDINIAPILKNRFFDQLRIDSIIVDKPQSDAFKVLDVITPIKLNPDEDLSLKIRFLPDKVGRYASTLMFYSNGRGSPIRIPMIGEGIIPVYDSIIVVIGSVSAAPGEEIVVPIYFKPMNSSSPSSNFRGVRGDLSFNSTLLQPLDNLYESDTIINSTRTLNIRFPFTMGNDTLLGQLNFFSALGNDTITEIRLSNLTPIARQKIYIEEQPGTFSLTDVCDEGGMRLFDTDGMISLLQNVPNPFNKSTEVTYSILERGFTKLYITNSMGFHIKDLVSGYLEPGSYKVLLDASEFPSGVYFYVLQTPTKVLIKQMLINK